MRFAILGAALAALVACDGKETTAGAPCEATEDCFVGYDSEELGGDPICFTDIPGGYCSQTCSDDASCCAADQCVEGFAYFCEALESNPDTYCFVSCEDADGGEGVCDEIGEGWICRNTGGGDGRKFCSPQ